MKGKIFLLVVSLLVVMSFVSACTAMPVAPTAGGAQAPASASADSTYGMDHKMKITFVTHDLGAGVFAPVRRGMEDACRQINAECEFLGPQTYNPTDQVAILEAAIAKQPDAIVTTRPDPSAYNQVLQKAIDSGIALATFNTTDPEASKAVPAPHVGQDFTNYGKVWAREVMRDLPEGGEVAVTDCCFGHFALEERIRSFKETLELEGEGKWVVREVINTSADPDKVYSAIEAYYQANQDIKGIYGVDYYSGIISEFIKKNNLQGKLKTGGSDLAPGNVDGLNEGYTSFGLGQNPYWQGYMPVMMMHQMLAFGVRPNTIDTGTDVVTPDNIGEFNPDYR